MTSTVCLANIYHLKFFLANRTFKICSVTTFKYTIQYC